MDNIIGVDILQSYNDTANEELDYMFRKGAMPASMIAQIATRHEVHYKIEIISVLESVDHINKERMA